MNPFTIGVAQKIAELPPYSGIGLRIVVFLLMYAVSVIFVYRHAMRVKRDPSLGIFGTIERKSREELISSSITLETKHKWILFVFLLNLVAIAIGVIKFGWYINEIAGLFILFGVIVGIIARLNTNKIVDEFMKGASALFYGALIIGVARAIVVILEQGHIMDTILFYCASLIEELPSSFTAVGMLVLQSIISFIIPSGSGMAALTMPIMTPLSELVGITRQTAVLAFQFGDGIWNLIVPGVALAGVGMVGISYVRWVKWIFPLLLIQFGIAAVVIFIAHSIGYGPF
jgi:uncharacterized ion transporter superfamily protein YfcC